MLTNAEKNRIYAENLERRRLKAKEESAKWRRWVRLSMKKKECQFVRESPFKDDVKRVVYICGRYNVYPPIMCHMHKCERKEPYSVARAQFTKRKALAKLKEFPPEDGVEMQRYSTWEGRDRTTWVLEKQIRISDNTCQILSLQTDGTWK